MKELSFEYGRENIELKKVVSSWLANDNSGGYVLVGPTGSGKTILLRSLLNKLNAEYFTAKNIYDMVCLDIRYGEKNAQIYCLPDKDTVFIDDLDHYMGETETGKLLLKLLCSLSDKKRLVVSVFSNYKLAEQFANQSGFELVTVKPVRATLDIIREKQREVGVHLTTEDEQEYADLGLCMMELGVVMNEVLYSKR